MLAPTGTAARIKAVPALAPYIREFFRWQDYIRNTAECKFHAYGETFEEGFGYTDFESKPMEYAHRFTPTYQKGQIASFYQLEAWMKANPRYVTLLTLTVYQTGRVSVEAKGHKVGIPEAFDNLKAGWNKLSKVLRKEIKGLDYIGVLEPHKSGYPHYHFFLLTFEPLTRATQEKCKHLWEQKYKVGSASRGVDFSFSSPEKPIASIRNYLSKYFCKAYFQTIGKYPNTDKRNEMTAGRYAFYALVWANHWRLVQKSNRLSAIMKYQKKESDIEYKAVELSRPVAGAHNQSEHREFTTIWQKEPGKPIQSIARAMSEAAQHPPPLKQL
jgi:hypothetical protein